jgi:hypothetical protein
VLLSLHPDNRHTSLHCGQNSPAGSGTGCQGLNAAAVFSLRDCSAGQNLAKLELQVVLATLLSRFTFSPGPELKHELSVTTATGQPVIKAVHALAGDLLTLQPLAGHMKLKITARTSS